MRQTERKILQRGTVRWRQQPGVDVVGVDQQVAVNHFAHGGLLVIDRDDCLEVQSHPVVSSNLSNLTGDEQMIKPPLSPEMFL